MRGRLTRLLFPLHSTHNSHNNHNSTDLFYHFLSTFIAFNELIIMLKKGINWLKNHGVVVVMNSYRNITSVFVLDLIFYIDNVYIQVTMQRHHSLVIIHCG